MSNLMDIYMDALSLTLMGNRRTTRLDERHGERHSQHRAQTALKPVGNAASRTERPATADVIAFPAKAVANVKTVSGTNERSAA